MAWGSFCGSRAGRGRRPGRSRINWGTQEGIPRTDTFLTGLLARGLVRRSVAHRKCIGGENSCLKASFNPRASVSCRELGPGAKPLPFMGESFEDRPVRMQVRTARRQIHPLRRSPLRDFSTLPKEPHRLGRSRPGSEGPDTGCQSCGLLLTSILFCVKVKAER